MPLTPADVHNVAFSKPPIGKRGYHEDEVDAFLDLVEDEMTKLIEENIAFRKHISMLNQKTTSSQTSKENFSYKLNSSLSNFVSHNELIEDNETNLLSTTLIEHQNDDTPNRAARLLSLAQETADRLINEANIESEQLLLDVSFQIKTLFDDVNKIAENTVLDAKTRSETLLYNAQNRSEAQLNQAIEKSNAIQAETEHKQSNLISHINKQITLLEDHLENLRIFEHEYKIKLQLYLESQLEELVQSEIFISVDESLNKQITN